MNTPEAAQPGRYAIVYHRGDTVIFEEENRKYGGRVLVKKVASRHPSVQELAVLDNEYEMTRLLPAASVRQVLGKEDRQGSPALILQPVDGRTLREHILASRPAFANRLRLAAELASDVFGIHKENIVHNDLTSGNVLVRDGNHRIIIIDLGGAMRRGDPAASAGTVKRDSLPYLAPEKASDRQLVADFRSDLYSLGVLLYEILTGELPFQAADPQELYHQQVAQEPPPPSRRNPDFPAMLDRIVLKLLAKDPEERYQSALGLISDLQECIRQQDLRQTIRSFPLCQNDRSGLLRIPDRLYGREGEIRSLSDMIRDAIDGGPKLILVSGYAGIGKSALVRQMRQPIVGGGGLFIQGKAEQYRSGIPYTVIGTAFQELVTAILSKSDKELAEWEKALSASLGDQGKALTEVVPGLDRIVQIQKEVAFLGGPESRNRLNYLVRKLIRGITGLVRPLVVFLDDLQWIDAASLDLLGALVDDASSSGFCIIGAYRDNEVGDGHPLLAKLEALERAGTEVRRITLRNLGPDELSALIAGALDPAPEIGTLGSLLFDKTLGNPFFATQLLHSLYEANQIRYDLGAQRWHWDIASLQALDVSANVIDHLASTVAGLESRTQEVLKLCVCIGTVVDPSVVAAVMGTTVEEITRELGKPGAARLLCRSNGTYRFVHDRIQQAIYGLVDSEQRILHRLKIGRHLLQRASGLQLEEALFGIADHLNAGFPLVADERERLEISRLNLRAARKARSSAAFAAMLSYLNQGIDQLPRDSWRSAYGLSLELYTLAVEAEYLNTDFEGAQKRAETVLKRARSLLDKIPTYQTIIQCRCACYRIREAIDLGARVLNMLGVSLLSEPPPDIDVKHFRRLPVMTDPASLAAMRILTLMFPPAMIAAPEALPSVIFTLVGRCLTHGNCAHSAFAYALYGLYLCRDPEGITRGYQFGQFALEILDSSAASELGNRVREIVDGFIACWHGGQLREVMDSMRRIAASALESGEIDIAGNQAMSLCILLYVVGEPLEAARSLAAMHVRVIKDLKLGFQLRIAEVWAQLQLNLNGLAEDPARLSGEYFDQERMLPELEHEHSLTKYYTYLPLAIHYYFIGDYEKALLFSELASEQRPELFGFPIVMTQLTYHALAILQLYPQAAEDRKKEYLDVLTAIRQRMAAVLQQGSTSFQQEHDLIEAETARVFGDLERALRHYERAIETAQRSRYLNLEALSCELAARFCRDQGLRGLSEYYLARAYGLYQRWGAMVKVRDLEDRYPDLLRGPSPALQDLMIPQGSILTSGRPHLESALKALRALSTETDLETLLNRMMGIVMEQAGAERGILLLKQEGRWLIQATGDFQKKRYAVLLNLPYLPESKRTHLPVSVVNLCLRSQKPLLIANALLDARFSPDPYVRRHRVKSILCLPLLYQGHLNGTMYLENRLSSEVFGRVKMETLELLCTQFSISFENALLYRALAERLRFEKLVARLSATFVNLPADKVDRQLAHWLRRVADYFDADRGTVYQLSATTGELGRTHCVARRGTVRAPHSLQGLPWYAGNVAARQTVVLGQLGELPPHAETERRSFSEQGLVSCIGIPMSVGGTSLGLIEFASTRREIRWSADVVDRLDRIVEVFAQALKRKHSEEALERSTAELKGSAEKLKDLSEHLQEVREHERTRIARGIHDELGQTLTVLRMDANWVSRHLGEDPGPLRAQLGDMVNLIDSATDSVQRICSELRPLLLDELGLTDAIEWLVEDFQKKEGIPCHLDCRGPDISDEKCATVVFRIIQEALTNISRHAQAREASVRLNADGRRISLEVDDDGRGITSEQAHAKSSLGLIGMRERVSFLGGTLRISGTIGGGTHLRVTLPLKGRP